MALINGLLPVGFFSHSQPESSPGFCDLYVENCYAYIMDRKRSIDIDTLDDFEYAEYLLKKELTKDKI